MPTDSDEPIQPETLLALSTEFSDLTNERWIMGEKEYGAQAFMAPDLNLFTMAAEELADLANYARMLYIRLRLLEEKLSNADGDHSTH